MKGIRERVSKSWADRESLTGKWVWPLHVWKQQLGPWWQSGLWEFKSKGPEVGVSPHRGLGQEGRLCLSKHPQLYLYYIFSTPGLFQRKERAVFQFPILFGLCLLFPYSVSDNVFVSGTTFTVSLCARTVFIIERYRWSVIVKCGESGGSLRDCFASPVFQRGPQPERISWKNNGTEALEQLYDERYSLHTAKTSSLFIES